MRILVINYDLGPGGTQRAAANLACAYHAAGLQTAFLAFKQLGPREEDLKKNKIPVFKTALEAAAWQANILHIFRWGHPEEETIQILKQLKKPGCKVVETNVFSFGDTTKDSSIIDLHMHLSKWCFWKWQKQIAHMKPAPRACVMPFIVDDKPFFPLTNAEKIKVRESLEIPANAFVLGRVGQPSMGKWSLELLDVFKKLSEKFPQIYLVTMGMPKEMASVVNSWPQELRTKVKLLEFSSSNEDLRQAYGTFDVFAHWANIGESFGMVIAEAMLCECPIVSLSTPRADNTQIELIADGGIVANNKNAFENSIALLLKNPELKSRLGKQGRQSILNRYTAAKIIPQAIKVLEAVLKSAPLSSVPKAQTSVKLSEIISLSRSGKGLRPLRDCLFVHHSKIYELLFKIRSILRPSFKNTSQ
jgi:glycosyltransferase involved in cell wall biosynthesis